MSTLREDMESQPLNRQTSAAREYLAEGHQGGHKSEPLLADGATNERRPAGDDEFSIRDEDRQAYGIKPEEDLRWIRDPDIWRGKATGDPERSFLSHNAGGRIIKTAEGKYVKCAEDLILAAVPREQAIKARESEEKKAFDQYVGANQEDFRNIQRGEADRQYDNSMRARNQMEGMGMIGPHSPTHGMSYEQAASLYGKKGEAKVDLEEARWRRPGRPVVMSEDYVQRIQDARAVADGRERREDQMTRRKMFGGTGAAVPRDANGRLYNTNSELQAAARQVADGGRARS